jgi:hypothetical protein
MSTPPKKIELTADQRARLAALAEQSGKTWRDVFDDALAAYHPMGVSINGDSAETFFDVASRSGVIGCITGTPPDLSTNPAYMEGFGQDDA